MMQDADACLIGSMLWRPLSKADCCRKGMTMPWGCFFNLICSALFTPKYETTISRGVGYLQDIFSLGCVLAELFLEGQRLFDLSEVELPPKPTLLVYNCLLLPVSMPWPKACCASGHLPWSICLRESLSCTCASWRRVIWDGLSQSVCSSLLTSVVLLTLPQPWQRYF